METREQVCRNCVHIQSWYNNSDELCNATPGKPKRIRGHYPACELFKSVSNSNFTNEELRKRFTLNEKGDFNDIIK